MGGKYYFAARPETLVSVVKVGKLRENLPDWVGIKKMIFFDKVSHAVQSSTTTKDQTFIIEIMPAEFKETNLLTKCFHQISGVSSIQAEQIETHWISHIYVYSEQGHKLARRLLNDESLVNISINSDIFETELQTKQAPLLHNVATVGFFSPTAIKEKKSTITYLKRGDILGSNMQTLINTVNTVGVMGKGIALSFKIQYPNMFADYLKRCQQGEVKIGQPYLYKVTNDRWIINFPTKQHWRNPSKLEYIEEGLKYLAKHLQKWDITSLAIPPLGCGNGQLNWQDVQPLLEKYLGNSQIPIEIYAPFMQDKTILSVKRHNVFTNNTIKNIKKQKLEEKQPVLKY